MNEVFLIGNLGAKPEVRTLENGNKVSVINIATQKSYKDNAGAWVNTTVWHRIVLWNRLAEVQMDKGNELFIKGEISNREYTDKEGIKRSVTEITASIAKVIVRRERESIPAPDAPPGTVYATKEDYSGGDSIGVDEPPF
jgi:single-strand DNA-binding protein